ncbi:NmrA family NAD(P)-binding protein [Mycobacterium yunnanensis]|uniref:NmrA family NAD(P)-binding protein n=1 Tax=Mycobacterium yunnanensis TaxID=368477 RepID=A0A9X2Z1I1_9MYCO|nr:NAD(P)H-binding protein [Mycobacterium yunnanensis]MCV7422140.1 NmrA family NAD(P)-binding protein [Mycobacterium yunnanensis]
MTNTHTRPILITGAAGEVGSVSTTMVRMLLDAGWPVRAFVRVDDGRAEALRRAGADVFVGDLLNVADVAAALNGCRRVYFSMGLSPYYVDANLLMVAVARAQGDLEVFVNISESEQTLLTFDRMTAPEGIRLSWLGGTVSQWSPQQRAHWIGEQVLDWSGLPVVHVRASIFVENPIFAWFPIPDLLATGELRLPLGEAKVAPIAGYDVAELCASILEKPAGHVGRTYTLIGPELKSMSEFADDYAAVLDRPVTYVPQDLESWNTDYVDRALAADKPHNAEHLKTLTRLMASGRYFDVQTDDLAALLGREPKTLRFALQNSTRIRADLAASTG